MCGCPKHNQKSAACECICDEHGNFKRAQQLAFERYDLMVKAQARLGEAQEQIQKLLLDLDGILVSSKEERMAVRDALLKIYMTL